MNISNNEAVCCSRRTESFLYRRQNESIQKCKEKRKSKGTHFSVFLTKIHERPHAVIVVAAKAFEAKVELRLLDRANFSLVS